MKHKKVCALQFLKFGFPHKQCICDTSLFIINRETREIEDLAHCNAIWHNSPLINSTSCCQWSSSVRELPNELDCKSQPSSLSSLRVSDGFKERIILNIPTRFSPAAENQSTHKQNIYMFIWDVFAGSACIYYLAYAHSCRHQGLWLVLIMLLFGPLGGSLEEACPYSAVSAWT